MAPYSGVDFYNLEQHLTEEERMVRDTVRDWTEENVLPVIEEHYMAGTFPMDLLPQIGEMGLFGCNLEGPIPQERILDDFRFILQLCEEENIPVPILVVADTMGWGNPEAVKRMIGALRELAPEARIGMHIHDTRGLGIANVYAALSMGVDMFESSVAGLGGCPFAGHGHARAAGNVCTEDAVFLCHELGIETGIDLDKLIAAANKAEEIIGVPLMGRVMHTGGLDKYRKAS